MSNFEQIGATAKGLANFWCNNTDCADCSLYDYCDSSKEYPLLDWLNAEVEE